MRRVVSLIFISMMCCMGAFAVIAKPGSGVYGDEYFNYRLDAQGRRLPQDVQGIQKMPMIDASFPTFGKVRSIVILVQYPDVEFITPNVNEAFRQMLNDEGYSSNRGTGSARDYFLASSMEQFDPTFDIYGPYTLEHERAYYKTHTEEMVIEACELADEEGGVDFKQYDYNADGYIDNVFIYYAGHNPAEGGPNEAIWPHRSVAATWDSSAKRYIMYSVDDLWIWDYACTSELTGSKGTEMCGIGTFCHEFSHVLGLDDLYNTANSDIYTVGSWDIMCTGSYNNDGRTPPLFSAYERMMMGWLTPEQLTDEADYLLPPLVTSNKAYLIAQDKHNMSALAPNPAEYWLVENRQALGWEAPAECLPGTGLLISHITFHKGKWDNNTPNNTLPLGYDICEAFYKSPYYSSPSDTYPGIHNITSFVPTNNAGDMLIDLQVQSIQTLDDKQITFHFGKNTGTGIKLTNDVKRVLKTEMLDTPTNFEIQEIEIEGSKLQDKDLFFCTNNGRFELSWDGKVWTNDTLWDEAESDNTYHRTLYLRYNPVALCETENGLLTLGTRSRVQVTQTIVRGQSVRSVLISEVQPLEPEDVTPYSFVARWEQQPDAEQYYLTLYTLKDEPYTDNLNVNSTLKSNLQTYSTPIYPADIYGLSLKFKHNYGATTDNKLGRIIVQATDETGQTWDSITAVTIRTSSKNQQQQDISLPNDKHYRRLRLVYNLLQGEGEVQVQTLGVQLAQHPEYIYSGNEYRISGSTTKATFGGLKAYTDYYYYLICQENKGCERNTSAQGPTMHIRTMPGAVAGSKFAIAATEEGIKAFLPERAENEHTMLIYDVSGRLIEEITVARGAINVNIPSSSLIRGRMYIAKYISGSKIKRKDSWAKFIY